MFNILICDDDKNTRLYLKAVLERENYSVFSACCGDDALELIQDYEKEILELRSQGKTGREICEKFGFSKKQYANFITRYNRRQDKIAAGIALKKKGRPAKDSNVTE